MPAKRIYQKSDGRWYYERRGEGVEGPFGSLQEAEKAMFRYIHSCVVRTQREPRLGWPRTWTPMRLLRREQHADAVNAP